jgi:hypothetical protein
VKEDEECVKRRYKVVKRREKGERSGKAPWPKG